MTQKLTPVYVSLGSNVGDTRRNLQLAVAALCSVQDVQAGQISSIYYTEPQGVKEQPWFANQVLRVYCGHRWQPWSFMQLLFRIEDALGRVRNEVWGPRSMDLDLLLFGHIKAEWDNLILPHPGLRHRAFVLVPLVEIEPDLVLPGGEQAKSLLQKITYRLQDNLIWQDS